MSVSWTVFDGFAIPRKSTSRSWFVFDELETLARAFVVERSADFTLLLGEWDHRIAQLDGDPCHVDWSHFRPLRTDREEDWSDWLQHFIATSRTGQFSRHLLGRTRTMSEFELARPTVVREDVIGDRRADLVILWSTGARSHIEVKVGDQAFSKTRDTAAKLEAKYPSREWSHYILLPAEDMPAWKAIEHSSSQPIHVITWDDVSACLRRCMVTGTEPLAWRVWAHGFTGLIEQKLLALPPASVRSGALGVMAKRARQISLMRRGLDSV